MALDTKFTMDELEVIGEIPAMRGAPTPIYKTPITPKENLLRLYEGKTPMWAPATRGETNGMMVMCDPDRKAKSKETGGGVDGFGVEWIYVEAAGGAMVKPGNPKITDIYDWKNCVTIPDPDSWDWEGFAKEQLPKNNPDLVSMFNVSCCLFERLIACMDFEYAVVALIDDEQKEGVHEFFQAVTDMQKKIYKNMKKYFNPEIVNWNDDMGSQRAQFFSNETYREMIMPYVKQIADLVHEMGMYFDYHCCGFVEPLVPLFIEVGFDSWGGQPLNDKAKLKELYDNGKFGFTANITLPEDATEEEMDRAVEEFIGGIGKDNRVLLDARGPAKLKEKLYIASRKNYDRLVAEGKAIL